MTVETVPQISPMPLPTQVAVGGAQAPDGQPLVVVQMATPQGMSVYFFDRDTARQVASMIRKQAETGPQLVVPPTGLVVAT